MDAWITQLRRGLIEYCLLKCLEEDESYGYEIVQRLKSIDELVISECNVYPILSRLLKDGYLKVRAVSSPSGPPRRYYSLTTVGARRSKEMDSCWINLCNGVKSLGQKGK